MMMELLSSLNRFNQAALNWFIPLADGTIKGAVILAILFSFLKLRQRLRPQTRHFILFMGMVAVLLIPWLTQGIATLGWVQSTFKTMVSSALSQVTTQSGHPQLPSLGELARPPIQIDSWISRVNNFGINLPHWAVWLFLVWISGVVFTGGKWIIENSLAYRTGRKGRPAHEPDWTELLDDLKTATGVRLPVTLKFSSTVPFPLVLGCFRPVILLPDSATDWAPDRRRAILLHEISHIRRYDNFTQILAAVTAIVFWFNPLIWIALRHLKTNRELACDDRVLETGILPSAYASHLIAVIQSLRATSLKLKSVAAMAAPNLEQRMVNILTKHVDNRKSLSKHNIIGLALIALLIVVVCSLGSVIGFAADNESGNYIQDPQVSIQGNQMELGLQGTILKGAIQEFPTLWPEQGVKHQIVSLFGYRFHPVIKANKLHSGIDISSPMGTPIVAAADGEVTMAGRNGNYGNFIAIRHKYLTSTYAMLDRLLVSSGDYVHRGELIAYSGASGLCTGPHLHYEIRYYGIMINPGALAGLSQ